MEAVTKRKVKLKQYRNAELLERHLGDPYLPASKISFEKIIALDEDEIYPQELLEHLHNWDFHHFYIPKEFGGKLTSFEEMLALGRVISRRDLTIAITDAHTFLGSVPVWISGNNDQKEKLARHIRNRKAGCLAVTEKDHGSDLISNKVKVDKVENGYLISGEKWPINKATKTHMLCVLAKSRDDEATSRSLSLFLVEKDRISENAYMHSDKIKTLGIRGCDISGIRFNDALLNNEALIGKEGEGLEITLKGFQVTRTLCAGLSLGAIDTALRTTLRFAFKRTLYGNTVYSLPHAKQTLVDAFTDTLIADCVGIFTARAMHVAPGQFSVLSAIVKYFVPTSGEKIISNLSVVLGARFYLRESHDFGIFQKIVRDNAIISLFDGSTIINLHGIALQLKSLAKRRVIRSAEKYNQTGNNLALIFSLDKELSAFNFNKLDLFSKGENIFLQGLNIIAEQLKGMHDAESRVLQHIHVFTAEINQRLEELESLVVNPEFIPGTPEAFEISKRYCRLHIAVLCISSWIYNMDTLDDFFKKGEWLVLCLNRLFYPDEFTRHRDLTDYYENASHQMQHLFRENRLFSIIPFQLGN